MSSRVWVAASGRASMFSRVSRLLPAASSAQVAWSRTTTPLTSHQPPAGPSRIWLCAGSGMSPKPGSGTYMSWGWFGQLSGGVGPVAVGHMVEGLGLAKSGITT